MTIYRLETRFAGAIVLSDGGHNSVHYVWFSRGWSHNYFIYFKALTSVITIHRWLDFEGGIDTLAE